MPSEPHLRRPERSAHASIRGYLYQACLGALRWLELEDGEILLCEGDEDLDRYLMSGDRTLEQVKDVSGNLGVTVVRETLRNFLLSWVHLRRQNEGVKFVFTSTAEVGKGSPAWPILDGWEDPDGLKARIDAVRDWVTKSGGTDEDQEAVERGLAWMDEEDGWAEFLGSIRWHLDQPNIEGVRDRIRHQLKARPDTQNLPADMMNLADRLICEIFQASSQPDPTDRQHDQESLRQLIDDAKTELVQWSGSPEADRIRKAFDETQALRELLDSGELDLQELPSDRVLPSTLLTAGYEVVPFVGRNEEWAEIQAWCEESSNKGVWLWSGEGGVGKSRFFLETCRRLRHQGWHAGFLPGDVDSAQIPALFRGVLPRLVVVDYAETRPEITQDLLTRLARHGGEPTVRVVLLARQEGAWWGDLFQGSAKLQHLGNAHARADTLAPLLVTEETRRESFQAGARHFAQKLDKSMPEPLVEPDLSRDEFQRILYLHMAALAALESKRLDTAEDLLAATLEHEERFWRRPGPNALEETDTAKLLKRAMAGFTLIGGVGTEERAKAWVPHLLDLPNEPAAVRFIRNQLHRLYGTPDKYIGPLQPDLLGEHLLEQVHRPPNVFLHQLLEKANHDERKHLLIVLLRLANRTGKHQWLHDLEGWLDETDNFDAIEDLHHLCGNPYFREAVPLFRVVVEIDKRALENHQKCYPQPDKEELGERARRFNFYAMALQNLRQFRKAVKPAREAVRIYQRIANSGNSKAQAHLANCLNNLGLMLGQLGEQSWAQERTKAGSEFIQQALENTQEAIKIYRSLPDDELDQCLPGLALSLMNLGIWLDRLGRLEDSIAPSKEAVDLYRELSSRTAGSFQAELARSLTNLAIRHLHCGQPEAALKTKLGAVAIYDELTTRRPDIFQYYLAAGLNDLGNIFAALDKPKKAHCASENSIHLLMPFYVRHTDTFQAQMANHWRNYLKHCENAGKRPRSEWAERLKNLAVNAPK